MFIVDHTDIIRELLCDGRWEALSPFVGGPRLAIRLARDCIFGPEVLMRSTVTGRNGMNPLQREGVKKIIGTTPVPTFIFYFKGYQGATLVFGNVR